MKNKNGFIATSVLYAFLLAFLTLFLAYTSNYLQNKQLLDRVAEVAKEDLDEYGNVSIADMEIGDYAIFDTIDDTASFVSPLNPNSKWILYSITKKSSSEETCKNNANSYSTYYFVSDINAQRTDVLMHSPIPTYASGAYTFGGTTALSAETYKASVTSTTKTIQGNLYYNTASSSWYTIKDDSNKTTTMSSIGGNLIKYYSYGLSYMGGKNTEVRLFTTDDVEKILEIGDDEILDNIFDQNEDYLVWSDTGTSSTTGYYIMNKHLFYNSNDVSTINSSCGSDSVYIDSDTNKLTADNSSGTTGYVHVLNYNNTVDYCYSEGTYIGTCLNSTCDLTSNNIRLVLEIKVDECNTEGTLGYADSGNGSSQLPYLITGGGK